MTDIRYTHSSFANTNPLIEWNNNKDGTYRYWSRDTGMETRPIPNHEKIGEIYNTVFTFARDEYLEVGCTFENCMKMVTEKFGEMGQGMIDYLRACPWDAGSRAGLLIEEPDHYI